MIEDISHALISGTDIQEYRIEKLLGEGGFGLTYLAFDKNLEKRVAIKEYLPSEFAMRGADATVKPRTQTNEGAFSWGLNAFVNEARMLGKFHNPYIVQVYRFFEANGTAYIVMEYVKGSTLKAKLKEEGEFDQQEVKAFLYPIIEGLEEVHKAGILHRDIKPENILIRDNGKPVLIDFGAARQALGAKSRSITSIITPGYAPIEQYSTKGEVGPWSDIYSLGAVVYYCLTLTKPEDASDRVIEDHVTPLSQSKLKSSISSSFLHAVDAALSVPPKKRPQTLKKWATQLNLEKPESDQSKTLQDTTRIQEDSNLSDMSLDQSLDNLSGATDENMIQTAVAPPGESLSLGPTAMETKVLKNDLANGAAVNQKTAVNLNMGTAVVAAEGVESNKHRKVLIWLLLGTIVVAVASAAVFKILKPFQDSTNGKNQVVIDTDNGNRSLPSTSDQTEQNQTQDVTGDDVTRDAGQSSDSTTGTIDGVSGDNNVDGSLADNQNESHSEETFDANNINDSNETEQVEPEQDSYPVFITTSPEGAIIEFVNSDLAFNQGIRLIPGEYEVRVSKSGYDDKNILVHIENNEFLKHVSLQPEISLAEQKAFEKAKSSGKISELQKYLASFPQGHYRQEVEQMAEAERGRLREERARREAFKRDKWEKCRPLPHKRPGLTGAAIFDVGSADFTLKIGRFKVRPNAIRRVGSQHQHAHLCNTDHCFEIKGKFGLQNYTLNIEGDQSRQGKACFYYLREPRHVIGR